MLHLKRKVDHDQLNPLNTHMTSFIDTSNAAVALCVFRCLVYCDIFNLIPASCVALGSPALDYHPDVTLGLREGTLQKASVAALLPEI